MSQVNRRRHPGPTLLIVGLLLAPLGCAGDRSATAAPGSSGVGGSAAKDADGGAGGGEGPVALAGTGATGQPGPSCHDLPATCGPNRDADCCASHVVPGGTFERDNGMSGDDFATISDFRLDDYEVTVGRFRNFVAGYADHKPATGSGRNPNNDLDRGWDARWNDSLPVDEAELIDSVQVCDAQYATYTAEDANLPMNCVTWFQAYAFCIWDGGRLPTDAETNYAAAGGAEQRAFPWSDPPDREDIDGSRAVYLQNAVAPEPVGSKSPQGDGRWGHADLSGNEWEWCQDWYRPYPPHCINCADLALDYTIRVIRGGSFYDGKESLYTTSRLYHAPNQPDFGVGLRCARAP